MNGERTVHEKGARIVGERCARTVRARHANARANRCANHAREWCTKDDVRMVVHEACVNGAPIVRERCVRCGFELVPHSNSSG